MRTDSSNPFGPTFAPPAVADQRKNALTISGKALDENPLSSLFAQSGNAAMLSKGNYGMKETSSIEISPELPC